jgi:hypothetical protein
MKSMVKIGLLGLLAVGIAAMPVQSRAQTNAAAGEKKTSHRGGGVPFHGKLKAADNKAKTISVGDLTIQITSDTKFTKGGKPATLADGVVGEEVSGSYKKGDDGKLTATRVTFGPHPEKAAPAAGEKKE